MKFSSVHIAAFRDASYDLNPLHLDADYARRSQFGRPVVYGMAAVLWGLGAWANGRMFRLLQLRALFRKPLFEGEEYALEIATHDNAVTLKFQRGPVDYCVITFSYEWLQEPPREYGQMDTGFSPAAVAATAPNAAAQNLRYCMNTHAWLQLQQAFALSPTSMPTHQLSAFLWGSYHVGMVLPGRQALFSDFQITFSEEDLHSAQLEVQLSEAAFDERFNRYIVQGSGPGIAELRIACFMRPEPVDFPWQTMPRFAEGYLPLQGKVAFVSGATRGFGAAMARICAQAGAAIALNYRGDRAAADALVQELQTHGATAAAFAADMTDPIAVAEMATAITHRFGHIDLIVNNAAPPIRDFHFLEQSSADFMQFVQQTLHITLETARQLLPLLSKGGHFLHISTKYLVEPVRGFSHYLTAKAAQEALVQALALEFRDHEFIVARLPRILTDQTNLAFDFDPPMHPGEVARDAILAMLQAHDDNYRAVNLFELE